jgi:hypothetical protein
VIVECNKFKVIVVIGSLRISGEKVRRRESKLIMNDSSEPLVSSKESTKVTTVFKYEEPIEIKINEINLAPHKEAQTEVKSGNVEQNVLPGTVTNEYIRKSNGKSTLLRTSIDSAAPFAIEVAGLEDYVQEDKIYVVIFP